ncbi:LAGLIDADG family homing endonuclease [Bacillus smithii]|uniref:LAGLIDADG family homing endonuclease n=1 Tax=Bacillus smithii TaxID=1479 RepID=UPI002E241F7E|nr:LAGLIDADG family homing endonuclease [Bacillus smithii]MED4928952.1 LAGLIDADG family homing endonuclease [Bacillus smithii]
MNIVVHKGRWSEKEINFLKDNYGKITANEIGRILGRTKSAVQLKANRLGLEVEDKYYYKKDFFKVIDTEEKAYWLGFIMADGCVRKTARNHELCIKLKGSDIHHLKKFNKCINGNIEVTKFTREGIFSDQRYNTGKKYEGCQIRLYSSEMVNDLISHGVYPDKSHKDISIPNLSNDLKWHFIRGFLDGDGHIKVPKKNKKYGYEIGFTCNSESFLMELKSFFNLFNIKSHIYPNRNYYRLQIRHKKSIITFLKCCFDNASIFLERKYNKYLQLKKLLSE